MKTKFFIFIFLFTGILSAQVFIPLFKGNSPPAVSPANPIYMQAGDVLFLTASGGMGIYNWSITGAAAADNAAVVYNFPTDTVIEYDSRDTSYANDTLTMTTPGYANITRTITTYDALAISPTSALVGVGLTQSFSSVGGCLNGANCVGGAYAYSLVSGIGSIHPTTGLYTAPAGTGNAVVQVADSIGNTSQATITVSNTLTISPTTARVPVYSTGLFSAISGTTPYTFSIFAGTGTNGCQSTLTSARTSADTTIIVTNTTGCPSVGSIIVGTEAICYTGTTATTFTGAVRGCNATTPAAQANGAAYNPAQTVYTAPTMIGAATVRVTDSTMPTAGTADAAVSVIKPVDIKVGQYFACALYDEGSVKCWGVGSKGQLGIGSTSTIGDSGDEVGAANQFVNLGVGRTAKKIATGLAHACAILDNDLVKCWGNGGSGRLGYSNTTSYGTTVANMASLGTVDLGVGKTATEIYAFGASTCAILNDATLKCWGSNAYGQLGQGDISNYGSSAALAVSTMAPVDLGTGLTAVKVVGGNQFVCALLNDASVKCWGRNNRGQLGKDSTTTLGDGVGEMGNSLTAINIGGGLTALDIVALYESVCVLRSNNTVICWGRNNAGQVGKGNTAGANASIGDAAGEMAAIASIAMGAGFGVPQKIYGIGQTACAEDASNVVKCWGYNGWGEALIGTGANITAPNTVASFGVGLVISKMASNYNTACAIFTNDRIKCWGQARTGTAGVVNGILLNGSVESALGDAAGELGNSLPYINH